MQELINSPYLKEKGFLGPFSLTEAFVTLGLCCATYILSMACEDWIGHGRLWTLTWTSLVCIMAFLGKVLLKHKNPTWLASMIAYHFLQPKHDRFRINFRRYPFLKQGGIENASNPSKQ